MHDAPGVTDPCPPGKWVAPFAPPPPEPPAGLGGRLEHGSKDLQERLICKTQLSQFDIEGLNVDKAWKKETAHSTFVKLLRFTMVSCRLIQ